MSLPWPKPWPEITAEKQESSGAGFDGIWVEYSRGSSKLFLSDGCTVTVQAGDSLSAYSQILYGTFGHVNVWGRAKLKTGFYPEKLEDLDPITSINLIHVGETLIHAGEMLERYKPAAPRAPKPEPEKIYDFRHKVTVEVPVGMEIVAADRYDLSGWGEYISTFPAGGYVVVEDIQTFVQGVQTAAGARKVSILHIQVHGKPGEMHFGDTSASGEVLSVTSLSRHRVTLEKLKQSLAPNAWIVVRSCETGQDLEFLRSLRRLWDVNIFAGTGDWSNIGDFNLGVYVVMERSGAEYYTWRMPNQIQSSLARTARKNW